MCVKSSPRRAQYRGFTLVELLIVIGIIMILVAILTPSLQMVKDNARTAVCLQNMRSIAASVRLYGAENQMAIPGAGTVMFQAPIGPETGYYDYSAAPYQRDYHSYTYTEISPGQVNPSWPGAYSQSYQKNGGNFNVDSYKLLEPYTRHDEVDYSDDNDDYLECGLYNCPAWGDEDVVAYAWNEFVSQDHWRYFRSKPTGSTRWRTLDMVRPLVLSETLRSSTSQLALLIEQRYTVGSEPTSNTDVRAEQACRAEWTDPVDGVTAEGGATIAEAQMYCPRAHNLKYGDSTNVDFGGPNVAFLDEHCEWKSQYDLIWRDEMGELHDPDNPGNVLADTDFNTFWRDTDPP